ncbi:MAG: hypothetical protein JWM85_643 [Acidimicrobiaceae bacterium]|nr:hypothetical protein [Acidimicrobiaceae bacterium]
MAIRNMVIETPPDKVWEVLADGWSYADWVVGTQEIRAVDPGWPALGTSIHYRAGVGPLELADRTTVRFVKEMHHLELEASGRPIGTARVSIEVLPWGTDETLVIFDEHPLRGHPLLLQNPIVDAALALRNRPTLGRLKRVVETRAGVPRANGAPPE